jgi:hypothetical protein
MGIFLSRSDRLTQPWWFRSFAASLIILLVGLGWFFIHHAFREPVYRGKTLTLWLRTYAYSSSYGRYSRAWNEADDAVHHIGTNGIPILLRMIRQKDSNLKLRLVALAKKQRLIKIHFVPAAERNVEASRAFIVLGDVAKGAVPALLKLCNENISVDSRCAIEDSLAWIGPAAKPAIPVLLHATTNSAPKVRANALWALGEIHAEPRLCIPVLIHALSDSNEWARLSAAHALGMFGTNAQSAVPWLMELAKNPKSFSTGIQAMLEARNALKKIGFGVDSPPSEPFPEFGVPSADWSIPPP